MGAVPVIAEPSHQLRPRPRGAPGVPAGLGGRPGEGEAGQRWNDYMEGIGRVASCARGSVSGPIRSTYSRKVFGQP